MGIDKSSSEWLFFKRHPSYLRKGQFHMKFYRDMIIAENDAYPGFSGNLRKLSLEVLKETDDIADLKKALAILTVVGTSEDIPAIKSLHKRRDQDLDLDIKTCIFEIEHA